MKTIKQTFKTFFFAIICIGFGFSFVSCSEEEDEKEKYECATCVDTPDALAVNDNSIKGIYKGTVVGSSGSIFIDIQNGSNAITARIVLDGITINLVSNVSLVEGEPYIAPFEGNYNGGAITVVFSVGLNGTNPTIMSSDIPGHPNAVFTVYKETSTSLIEAFEGEFMAGGNSGIFNIILSREINKWEGIAKKNNSGSEVTEIGGTINSNNELIQSESGKKLGKISGDTVSGSFTDEDGENVTFNGERTL